MEAASIGVCGVEAAGSLARPVWDWGATAFGPRLAWPPALRLAHDLCLDAPASCCIYWGRDFRLLYNQTFASALGVRHPWALGRPFREVWPEGGESFTAQLEAVLASGVGCMVHDQPLTEVCGGVEGATYWTYVLTPVRAENGHVEGVTSLAMETTERVVADSRSRFLLGLEHRMRALSDPQDVLVLAAEALGRRIGASEVAYAEIDADVQFARLRHSWSDVDMPSNAGTHRLDDFGMQMAADLRAGRSIIVHDVATYAPTSSPEALAAYARVSVAAFLNLPIVRKERLSGIFLVHNRTARHWTAEDISLAERVAERTWTTMARARAEAELRELNETLEQRVAERTRERDQSRRASQDILEVIDAGGSACDDLDPVKQEEAIERLRSALRDAHLAVRAKDDFLANMSHELRTPLNSIVGFSGLIAEAPELSTETRRRAKIVSGASQSLVAIVNDILDISKMQSEGVALAPEPMLVRDVVVSAIALVRDEAAQNGVGLSVETHGGARLVLLDPARLRQVILNLVGNAIKFTPKGGQVVVTLDEARDGVIKLSVRDTGVGIPKDRVDSIFDRFAQADSTTTRRFGGTGLGLTISRSIVAAMGGAIGVESEPGVGSTFWFTVQPPSADPRQNPARAPNAFPQMSVRGVRVLLADDNEVNRDLFRALMREHQLEIEDVADGAQAVEAVASRTFDLVLMDVQMPVMDGLDAARAIRASGSTVPIIALTANVMQSQVALCLAAGMNDHLGKPFIASQVRAAIAKWGPTRVAVPVLIAPPANDVLSDLRVKVGDQGLTAFLHRLADQLRELLPLLVQPPSNPAELERRVHKVRGAAASLGFAALATTYEHLERATQADAASSYLLSQARTATEAALHEIAREARTN